MQNITSGGWLGASLQGNEQNTPAIPAGWPDAQVRAGDPAQYVIGKLHLAETHRLATGDRTLVAVIDSGITPWHDDLAGDGASERVDQFVDFVAGRADAYDDYGHGTHVAGIIAGNGFDSSGARAGVAPNARLIVLKVLDAAGHGRISDVIAAFDYVVANKDALKIRVVNLSVATRSSPHQGSPWPP